VLFVLGRRNREQSVGPLIRVPTAPCLAEAKLGRAMFSGRWTAGGHLCAAAARVTAAQAGHLEPINGRDAGIGGGLGSMWFAARPSTSEQVERCYYFFIVS
jgi:hypothetical protein